MPGRVALVNLADDGGFRSDPSLDDERTVISLRESASEKLENASGGIDLLVTVKGRKLRYAGFGVLIGVLLAFPTSLAAFGNTNLPTEWKWAVGIASLVAGIATGEVAAFGLRKL